RVGCAALEYPAASAPWWQSLDDFPLLPERLHERGAPPVDPGDQRCRVHVAAADVAPDRSDKHFIGDDHHAHSDLLEPLRWYHPCHRRSPWGRPVCQCLLRDARRRRALATNPATRALKPAEHRLHYRDALGVVRRKRRSVPDT